MSPQPSDSSTTIWTAVKEALESLSTGVHFQENVEEPPPSIYKEGF